METYAADRGKAFRMSGRSFRLFGILFYMVLSLAFMPDPAWAAAQPKLNKTSLTINAGKSYKLKLKNYKKKAAWKSSNSYVASVSKKGVVKAKHMGYTVITVTAGETTLKCRVTVRGKKSEKPYISCSEVDRNGETIETGEDYNFYVVNGQNKKWTWTIYNTDLATLYVEGNHLATHTKPGGICELVETFMGRPGTVLITAKSGSTTLRYNMRIQASAEDIHYTQVRNQVLSQLIRPGMSAQEQCLVVAKWLSDYASYLVTNGPDYSLLNTHLGQCYHYAKTYEFLMAGTGIPCIYVNTKDHAWNQVQIDGDWYNIDVTSFDNEKSDIKRNPYIYNCFLVSDYSFWNTDRRCQPYHVCANRRYDFNTLWYRSYQSPWATGTWVNY